MNEVERLLRRDRVAGIPEPPDLRYTEAAVRRRAKPAPQATSPAADWWIAFVAPVLVLLLAAVLWCFGLSPWWLTALPLLVLPLIPLLLPKERERS